METFLLAYMILLVFVAVTVMIMAFILGSYMLSVV